MKSSKIVGSLDPAYFEGRGKTLDFLNDVLWLNLVKIEETASGAVACQLMSLIYPESIPLNRVHWNAKAGNNRLKNYRLLQEAFDKLEMHHSIDSDKLSKGVYKENLELCQFLHALYNHHKTVLPNPHNPAEVRALHGVGGDKFNKELGDQEAIAAGAASAEALRAGVKEQEDATTETDPAELLVPPPSQKPNFCCWFCV